MTYPLSSEVTAGQPTAAAHYNNLRQDSLYLGNEAANSLPLANFLNRHFEHLNLQYLATNRLRVPYSVAQPPTLMINGCMLQAAANVDLPSNQFSGAAATWYIFAVRSDGSTTFTLTVNTSAAEATDQRLIGECNWDGTTVTAVKCYFTPSASLAAADYDSGWFAVGSNTYYSKTHGLGVIPRFVLILWNNAGTGAGPNYPVFMIASAYPASGYYVPYYADETVVYMRTGSTAGTCASNIASSCAGFWRILAWK